LKQDGKEDFKTRRSDMCIFNKTLAEALGLNEAILFEYVMFMWTQRYFGRQIGDKWWLYFSATELHSNFPFLSRATIHRTMQNLTGYSRFEEPLFEKNMKFNKHRYDRTTWYTPTSAGRNLYRWAVEMSQYKTDSSHFEKSYLKLRNAFYKIGVKLCKLR
jgi:hypothetical protein